MEGVGTVLLAGKGHCGMSSTRLPFFIVLGLLVFVMFYPVIEWNWPCGPNETCRTIKGSLWEVVALLSLYSGDGIPFTPSVDERDFRNVFPLVFVLMIVIFINFQKGRKNGYNR